MVGNSCKSEKSLYKYKNFSIPIDIKNTKLKHLTKYILPFLEVLTLHNNLLRLL